MGGYVNPPEAAVQVEQFSVAVNSISPLMGVMETCSIPAYSMIWQQSETSAEQVAAFSEHLGSTMRRLVREVLPEPERDNTVH